MEISGPKTVAFDRIVNFAGMQHTVMFRGLEMHINEGGYLIVKGLYEGRFGHGGKVSKAMRLPIPVENIDDVVNCMLDLMEAVGQ